MHEINCVIVLKLVDVNMSVKGIMNVVKVQSLSKPIKSVVTANKLPLKGQLQLSWQGWVSREKDKALQQHCGLRYQISSSFFPFYFCKSVE